MMRKSFFTVFKNIVNSLDWESVMNSYFIFKRMASLAVISVLTVGCGGGGDGSGVSGNNITDTPYESTSANSILSAPSAPSTTERNKFEDRKYMSERDMLAITNWSGYEGLYELHIGDKIVRKVTHDNKGSIVTWDYRSLPQGFASLPATYVPSNHTRIEPYVVRSYQGFRSGVVIAYDTDGVWNSADLYGVETPIDTFPSKGRATYRGTAFDDIEQEGKLTYFVDFADKSGNGVVEGLDQYGTVILEKGKIEPFKDDINPIPVMRIHSNAIASKGQSLDYEVQFYGDNAEEIAGFVGAPGDYGFGIYGTRGAINE